MQASTRAPECGCHLRARLRLIRGVGRVECTVLITPISLSSMPTPIHRFEQEIGGRLYVIEASPVHANRWRAQIARRPGMPSALMPFYGTTADEAASLLVRWLTLAHRGPAESTP